jgi:D-alanyl-D-alanine carboxypeptidase
MGATPEENNMKRRLFVLILIKLHFVSLLFACSGPPNKIDLSQDLRKIVEEYLSDKSGVLGTIVQVNIGGKKSYQVQNGFFDLSRKTPIKTNDKFIIGSITKVFTATLVLQLVENNLVKLDGLLIDYLPSDWAMTLEKVKYGRDVTVEHAISHRSGLFDVFSIKSLAKVVMQDPSRKWTPFEVFETILTSNEPTVKPGELFDYCNTNFLLLGALIEQVTNKSYPQVLYENILKKIGLVDTFLTEGLLGTNDKRIAHSYLKFDDRLYDAHDFDMSYTNSVGGLISTTEDLIKYVRALASGELYKNEKTFQQMIKRVKDNRIYGLGLEVRGDEKTGIYYSHLGSFLNTSSIVSYFPLQDISICICNTYDGSTERLQTDILMKLVMKELFGIEVIDPGPDETRVLKYAELNFKIMEIKKFKEYTIDGREYTSKKNSDFFLIQLEGRGSIDMGLQLKPSQVSLQYNLDDKIFKSECFAVGQFFKTESGMIEIWMTREDENTRTREIGDRTSEEIVMYILCELPSACSNIAVLFN